jgi:hypothetical protein
MSLSVSRTFPSESTFKYGDWSRLTSSVVFMVPSNTESSVVLANVAQSFPRETVISAVPAEPNPTLRLTTPSKTAAPEQNISPPFRPQRSEELRHLQIVVRFCPVTREP